MAGVRSLFAFWLGGAGAPQAAATVGFRTALPPWGAGVSTVPPAATAGAQSMFAFWMGGAGLFISPEQAPEVSPLFDGPRRRWIRDPDDELAAIIAAIAPQLIDMIKGRNE